MFFYWSLDLGPAGSNLAFTCIQSKKSLAWENLAFGNFPCLRSVSRQLAWTAVGIRKIQPQEQSCPASGIASDTVGTFMSNLVKHCTANLAFAFYQKVLSEDSIGTYKVFLF